MNKNKINKNNKNKRYNRGGNRDPYNQRTSEYITTVQKPIFGFIQPRILTTLKYNTGVIMTNTAGAGASYKFKLNSLFDPEDPVGGHQPYGFDTCANIYSRYTVIKVRYEIEFGPSSDRLFVGVLSSSNNPTAVTSFVTFTLAAESPFSRSKALSFSGGVPATFRGSVTINELMGLTPSQLIADDQFSAPVTSDPAQLVYMMIYSYNPTATTPVVTNANCTLWFESVMFDPYLQNQS